MTQPTYVAQCTHDASRLHFHTLTREQQAEAIHRMAAAGHSEHTIAAATGLSVEFVRRVLGERQQTCA